MFNMQMPKFGRNEKPKQEKIKEIPNSIALDYMIDTISIRKFNESLGIQNTNFKVKDVFDVVRVFPSRENVEPGTFSLSQELKNFRLGKPKNLTFEEYEQAKTKLQVLNNNDVNDLTWQFGKHILLGRGFNEEQINKISQVRLYTKDLGGGNLRNTLKFIKGNSATAALD
jgi:hypothetical protein